MSFIIKKGTNVSHWLSQNDTPSGEYRRKYFTRDDVMELAALGMDHLRIPIDEVQMWDLDLKRKSEAWELLNNALDWCEEAGLKAIIDLHILRSHYFVDEEDNNTLFSDDSEAKRLGAMWADLSSAFCNRSNELVAYELMNEAVAKSAEDWNRVLIHPYNAIRKNEPKRMIAIGSNNWCQPQTFPDLKVPENDPNIILVVHFYFPMFITHYTAEWSAEVRDYKGKLQYPGQPIPENDWAGLSEADKERYAEINIPYGPEAMLEKISPAIKVAKKYNLTLWCNEFGVINRVEKDIASAWYKDFISVLEDNNISWSNWDMRGQFGLFCNKTRKRTAACNVLFPQS